MLPSIYQIVPLPILAHFRAENRMQQLSVHGERFQVDGPYVANRPSIWVEPSVLTSEYPWILVPKWMKSTIQDYPFSPLS
jgi:hypothetical protein